MLRKIAKFFAWVIGGVLGLVVLLYLVVLGINWRDVAPSEEAKRFAQLYENRPQVADERNGFVFLVGMTVEAAHDPLQAGRAMIERARNTVSASELPEYTHANYPQFEFNKGRAKEAQVFIDSCKYADEQCLIYFTGNSVPVIQPGSSDEILLKRYRSLIALPEWQDIYPGGMSGPIPPLSPAMTGQVLSMIDIWHKAESRGANLTIAMLDEDARFWRKVLRSSDSLITSMFAVSALKKNMFWTNLVMRRLFMNNIPHELPASWLEPVSDEERLMVRAWVGEWALGEPTMRRFSVQVKQEQESSEKGYSTGARIVTWLILPLYQPQESINRHAHDLAAIINESNVHYDQLMDVIARRKGASEKEYEELIATADILYNPIGKFVFYATKPDFGRYMLRVPDLEGGRRALLAIYQLRSAKTPRGKIGEALATSSYRNPYTRQPFAWDEASWSVVFEGMVEGKQRRYFFPY